MRWLILVGLVSMTACTDTGPRFEIDQHGEKFTFRLYAEGTKLLLESDPYTKKASAKAGVKALRAAFPKAKCFRHRIVIKAGNGQPLARSPKYADKRTCEEGLALAKQVLGEAKNP